MNHYRILMNPSIYCIKRDSHTWYKRGRERERERKKKNDERLKK